MNTFLSQCRLYQHGYDLSHMVKDGKYEYIYVRYMSKCIKYIFSKSCIFKKYFTYILYIYIYIFAKIYLTYIWSILDIYLNDAKIYFCFQKFYMSHIYLISMGGIRTSNVMEASDILAKYL